MRRDLKGLLLAGYLALSCAQAADARIARITIDNVAPAFGGQSLGAAGAYQTVTGMAYGEVDPHDRRNAIIQDIALAPRNARGMVEYATPFQILMPTDPAKGNRTLLFEVVNRGHALDPGNYGPGDTPNGPVADGFLEAQGFTLVVAGWQADMVTQRGPHDSVSLFALTAPVATEHSKPITGTVRVEWTPTQAASTQNIATPNGNQNTLGYPAATLDNRGLTLTARVNQNGARQVIPNDRWAFADCSAVPFPGTPDPLKLCIKSGFDANHIYELVYTAKNPIVMGLGLAAIRDVGAFFHHAMKDDKGTPNPLAGRIDHTLVNGISQSGRLLRGFINLGFNEDEKGRIVYGGAQPQISAAGDFINIRFAQPGRLAGTQHTETQFPGSESPVAYGDQRDDLTGKSSGLLYRCRKTKTCPKILQTLSDIEYWQSSGRADTTDAAGTRDVDIPDTVRIYQFSSTQHSGFKPDAPLPTKAEPRCQQFPNANPYFYNLRAIMITLQQWVADGTAPPPSRYARLSDATLVPLAQLVFPKIPGLAGPQGVPGLSGPEGIFNTRYAYDRGPRFHAEDGSGIIDREPPKILGRYPSLVPQVDADGNDVGGLRSHILQAPLGTYMGWNSRAEGFSRGDSCDLVGGYVPFAVTAAERVSTGDPRLSLQERYTDTSGYVKAVTAATDALIHERTMLAADRQSAIDAATTWFKQAAKGELP